MNDISIVYYGYVFDGSGYGHAARAYIHALHSAGISMSVVDLAKHARQVRDELVESLIDRKITPDFHIFHGIPPEWARLAFSLPNAIGMTVWETDTMPSQWRNILNHVLEVWLPCEFNVSIFRNALEKPVFKLPHPLLLPQSNGQSPQLKQSLGISDHDFVFYSIFEWQERKCPAGMIESYLRAFPSENQTVLIIKSNPAAAIVAHRAVEEIRCRVRSKARVEIRCEAWSDAQIAALHRRGNCYLSLHRGEGWGYPLFEAASLGTPVIATGYSGPLEYLNREEHHLIGYDLIPVRQPYLYYHPHMRWAEPDLSQAIELMHWVHSHRELARERATKAAAKVQQAYSLECVGTSARNQLLKLLEQTQPLKWQKLKRTEHVLELVPSKPIAGEWYDEDYFEKGLKSNWDHGYSWLLFQDLFRETATFLTNTFFEASSYLDIGCAKGFLVRALRERAKECWGFDHSPWAIEHAEESSKPFIERSSVDEIDFDRQFDLLVAFGIFESLTESQLRSFLSRARAWTRQAIFATIPSFQSEEEESLYYKNDKDLSHITMHTREWWHEMFLSAGWRQDPLHRIVQRMCQNHELSRKMGWKVYVYAPSI